jgi:predicted small secreted protein
MVRKIGLAVVLLGLLCITFGCNTIRGMGEDISVVGESITRTAGGP